MGLTNGHLLPESCHFPIGQSLVKRYSVPLACKVCPFANSKTKFLYVFNSLYMTPLDSFTSHSFSKKRKKTTFSTSQTHFMIHHPFAITFRFHFHPFHHHSPLPPLTRLIHQPLQSTSLRSFLRRFSLWQLSHFRCLRVALDLQAS